MNNLVNLNSVGHAFGETEVLSDIALEIPSGSYTVLLGPSGSGKTTLLSILGGFLVPTRGQVLVEGVDVTAIPPARRPTATVFQDYALFPHMNVTSNVAFGLRMRGVGRAEQQSRAKEALQMVGLSEHSDRRPHQLSGGQRQRVALARALVIEPKVLLLDEPLGALDLALRRQMQDELKATQQRVGTAFVHVTHDQEEAMALADVVVVMNAGRIEDFGSPERVYARPASRFTATFMGESTVIEGRVVETANNSVSVDTTLGQFTLAGDASVGEAVALGARPESIKIRAPRDGEVTLANVLLRDRTFQGSFMRLRAITPSGEDLLIKCPSGTYVPSDEAFPLAVRPEDLILLQR